MKMMYCHPNLKNHQKLVLRFKLLSANTIAITINQTVSFYLLVNIFFGIIGLSFLLQENLSSINILKILIDGGGGDLVERYNETQNISDMDRQEIVRIIMADLTNKTGNLYPSSEMKERTAKALVEFFPWLSIHRSYTALPFFQLPDRRIFWQQTCNLIRPSLKIEQKFYLTWLIPLILARRWLKRNWLLSPKSLKNVSSNEEDKTGIHFKIAWVIYFF